MWFREGIGTEALCSCLTPVCFTFPPAAAPSVCSSQGSSAAGEWNPSAFFARCLHTSAAVRVAGSSAALLHPGRSTHISNHLAQSPLAFVCNCWVTRDPPGQGFHALCTYQGAGSMQRDTSARCLSNLVICQHMNRGTAHHNCAGGDLVDTLLWGCVSGTELRTNGSHSCELGRRSGASS